MGSIVAGHRSHTLRLRRGASLPLHSCTAVPDPHTASLRHHNSAAAPPALHTVWASARMELTTCFSTCPLLLEDMWSHSCLHLLTRRDARPPDRLAATAAQTSWSSNTSTRLLLMLLCTPLFARTPTLRPLPSRRGSPGGAGRPAGRGRAGAAAGLGHGPGARPRGAAAGGQVGDGVRGPNGWVWDGGRWEAGGEAGSCVRVRVWRSSTSAEDLEVSRHTAALRAARCLPFHGTAQWPKHPRSTPSACTLAVLST